MTNIMYRIGRTPMFVKIFVGFFLGMLFGFIAAPMESRLPFLRDYLMPSLDLAGKIFLKLLTMIIIPLVFSTLVAGASSIGDTKKLGRIGIKTLALSVITTLAAIFVAFLTAYVIRPGLSINIPDGPQGSEGVINTFADRVLDIFPVNFLASMVNAHMLHIIIFSMLLGIICLLAGEVGARIADFFEKVAVFMQTVTQMILTLAPLGVFALSATATAEFGLKILAPFATVIAAMYAACILHAGVVYSLVVIAFCRRSPKWFFRGIREAAITAFVTRSSSVTLPVTMSNVRENLGVSEGVSSFVLPLGATMNMDGTAMYEIVSAIFVADAYGIPITLPMIGALTLTAWLASIGAAGIPGTGLVMLTMVLTSAGLPVEGAGLIAGIDVVLGAARTCINVVGDGAVCVAVAASEGEHLTENN